MRNDGRSFNYSRKISEIGGFDVMVAGGGPAGFAAAAAAAREGMKTLLVEATGCLGGMASSGLVAGWCGFHDKEKFIHRGLAERMRKGLQEYAGLKPSDDIKDQSPVDPEGVKLLMDSIVEEAGVEILFNTTLSDVMARPDGTVEAAIVANKDGLSAVRARLFIDCTGDGDLCARAGARFEKGDAGGDMQPATLCHTLVNLSKGGGAIMPEDYRKRMVDDPKYPLIKDDFFGIWPGRGFHIINGGHLWGVDGSDIRSVTKAMIEGRKLARQFRDAYAEHIPSVCKDGVLLQTASLLGVRETRRIIGDYILTEADHKAQRRFDDEISLNSFFIDIHPSWANRLRERRGEWSWEKEKRDSTFPKGGFHGIPYRCLTPVGLKNVLNAGRSVSSDRVAQSAVRVMPPCMTMGEAAGVAAAMSAKETACDVHKVDVGRLRGRLCEHGAFLPDIP